MKFIIGFILLGIVSLSRSGDVQSDSIDVTALSSIETFVFSSNDINMKGKIFLPAAYKTNKKLPAIFLVDFTEQHFKVAIDEFEKVIEAVQQIQGFDALVITLEEHFDKDVNPENFQDNYEIFKNMADYVDGNYTKNNTRTFIGRGSEAGIVLMTLFLENSESNVFDNFIATDSPESFNSAVMNMIEKGDFPKNKLNKKLHFSFSTSNNRDACIKMINKINEAQYPWLAFESIEYQHTTYEKTYPVSFAAGIRFVFSK